MVYRLVGLDGQNTVADIREIQDRTKTDSGRERMIGRHVIAMLGINGVEQVAVTRKEP